MKIRKLPFLVLALFFQLFFVSIVFAKEEIIPNELTVLYENSENTIDDLEIDQEKIETVKHVSDKVDVVVLKDNNDSEEVLNQINNSEAVEVAENDFVVKMLDVPNDKYYSRQGYLKNINYEATKSGSNKVKVAVLDTGVNSNHEDLNGRVELSGKSYIENPNDTSDLEGHGTFVAGIIAATTNNSIGIAGITKTADIQIVPYRVLDGNGEGRGSYIIACLEELAKRDDIKVINLSFGFESGGESLEKIVNDLTDKGKIVVASSGNTEKDQVMFPARFKNSIAVGAVDLNNKRCDESIWGPGMGSSYGEDLDIMAPGNEIASLTGLNEYSLGSGTSYSAPIVSGAVALAFTFDPNLTQSQVENAIETTSKDLESPGWDPYTGYGLIQLNQFVDYFSKTTPSQPVDPTPQVPIQNSETIYRLYNKNNSEHFYTSSKLESDEAVKNGWTFEGVGWIAPKAGQPVYRLYDPKAQNHLYTVNKNEVDLLTQSHGWVSDYNGAPVFYSGGDIPIYRLYNAPLKGMHLLTTNSFEYESLPTYSWQQEGIALYATSLN